MSETLTLSTESVEAIVKDCLFRDDEDKTVYILAEGIVQSYGFHPERLESHRMEITALLAELPDLFREDKGGGMTFLDACQDRHGNQWTSYHRTMDALFCLGIALGLAEYLLPRDMWQAMPGGVPYVQLKI